VCLELPLTRGASDGGTLDSLSKEVSLGRGSERFKVGGCSQSHVVLQNPAMCSIDFYILVRPHRHVGCFPGKMSRGTSRGPCRMHGSSVVVVSACLGAKGCSEFLSIALEDKACSLGLEM